MIADFVEQIIIGFAVTYQDESAIVKWSSETLF